MQSNDSARLEMLVHRVRGPSLGWLPSIGFLQHPKKIRSGQVSQVSQAKQRATEGGASGGTEVAQARGRSHGSI
jgi:hypothetical protein